MRLISYALIAASIAGAALAQTGPMMFVPTYDASPSPAEVSRRYPRGALDGNVSGIAVLCCTANDDRSLTCALNSEYPAGRGFGQASLEASHSYRLSAQSQADLAARPGTQVRVSMLWAAPVIRQSTIDDLQSRDMETIEACLAPQ